MLDYARSEHLLRVIEQWLLDTELHDAGVPNGILELHDALGDDLRAP